MSLNPYGVTWTGFKCTAAGFTFTIFFLLLFLFSLFQKGHSLMYLSVTELMFNDAIASFLFLSLFYSRILFGHWYFNWSTILFVSTLQRERERERETPEWDLSNHRYKHQAHSALDCLLFTPLKFFFGCSKAVYWFRQLNWNNTHREIT